MVLNLAVLAVLVVRGRWEPVTRALDLALAPVLCGVLTWVVVAGPIFVVAPTDQFVRAILVMIILVALVDLAMKVRRQLRRRAPRLTAVV